MKITIGKTEFEGIGYFESDGTLYMTMYPNSMTLTKLENLVRDNDAITIDEEQFTGYTDLDAITFTYHTKIGDGEITALNIQTKRS